MPGPCPTTERLAAALRNRHPGGGDAELAAHLAECPTCQKQLEALAGGSGWLEAKAKAHTASTAAAPQPLMRAMQDLESHGSHPRDEPQPPKLDFLQPSDQPGVLGKFGPYEVIAHIASGGMGIVLKARDPALDRIVALKILSPTLAANALARARFVREARAAAAVVHDNVVPIYAVDESGGLPYLVMQFVKGRTLAERIRATGPLRLEEILRIGAQTAAGLAAAHAQGLIHRDVKPGNILLENSVERVKLTDFGLARAADDIGLTRTGELAGTPEYMAPEQAGNGVVDHRADLFSFGSVLYAMCTGASPFKADSVLAIIRKVCDDQPPPVHEINPAMPRWLSDIVARLMAKAPAQRFQSAHEVRDQLERYLARVQYGELGEFNKASQSRPATARARPRIAISAAAAVAMLGFCTFLFKEDRPGPYNGGGPPTNSPISGIQDSFVVRNESGTSVGAFANIEDALAAAPSAGVVELRWNGPREVRPITLPPKALILRAAAGFHPVWVHTSLTESALNARAALTVEDIEMSLRADATAGPRGPRPRPIMGPTGIGLIAISSASLRVSRSVLQLPDPQSQSPAGPLAGAGLSGIVLDDVPNCELENTALLANRWTAILWRQTADRVTKLADGSTETRLSVTNCIVTAFRAFRPELLGNSPAQLQMVRSTFQGLNLIEFQPNGLGRSMSVVALTNLFATVTTLGAGPNVGPNALAASMRWQGGENLFSPPSVQNRGPGARGSPPITLAEWNRLWPEPERGSREVSIEFAGAAGSSADFAPTSYKITNLNVIEGPPLPSDQWSRFGADIDSVGPASR